MKERHGHTINRTRTPEYRAWLNMRQRCYYPKHEKYRFYGGLGVRVCERWRCSFMAFLSDLGQKPSKRHSLDRIDPFGNYEPINCRWVTKTIQLFNKRRS